MNSYYKKSLLLTKDYFLNSKDRLYAWLFLIGSILGVIALVGLNSVFSWWLVKFFASLTAASSTLFMSSMQYFLIISLAWIILNTIKEYCVLHLKLNWRTWLMERIIPLYTNGPVNYLELHRHDDQIDNPEQRIQEDTSHFVDQTVALSLDLLHSVLSLISFTASLWVIGGNLSLTLLGLSLFIPGYMVWASILFSVLASLITHWIGHELAELNKNERQLEANMRKDLFILNQNAESIALLQGQKYHEQTINRTFKAICINWLHKIIIKLKLSAFSALYEQFTVIFPYIMAAPALFSGKIGLDQVMQCAYTFSQVQSSLSWFIDSYENLAKYKTHMKRFIELYDALHEKNLNTAVQNISVTSARTNAIEIQDLELTTPKDSTHRLLSGLHLRLSEGENIVIQGENGLGKSTLFKVIAGTWTYGRGKVICPHRDDIYVIPQKPVMIKSDLKELLAYPSAVDTFTDQDYQRVIQSVGFSAQKTKQLQAAIEDNTIQDWSSLSGGEQQKIEFARAMLRQPRFILLDESTAAMDSASEDFIYQELQKQGSTFISIAHRDVKKHHTHQCFLNRRQNELEVEARIEEHQGFRPSLAS